MTSSKDCQIRPSSALSPADFDGAVAKNEQGLIDFESDLNRQPKKHAAQVAVAKDQWLSHQFACFGYDCGVIAGLGGVFHQSSHVRICFVVRFLRKQNCDSISPYWISNRDYNTSMSTNTYPGLERSRRLKKETGIFFFASTPASWTFAWPIA